MNSLRVSQSQKFLLPKIEKKQLKSFDTSEGRKEKKRKKVIRREEAAPYLTLKNRSIDLERKREWDKIHLQASI